MKYIIVKKAIYDHGVMFMSNDIEEAKIKADYFASNFDDGHHCYEVREFNDPEPENEGKYKYDWKDNCKVIYTGIKS